MLDLKISADRMEDTILREEREEYTKTLKLWNQRMRQKREIKAPITVFSNVKCDFISLMRIDGSDNISSMLRININSNKIERPKFFVQLSRKEIEEDFMAWLGRQPRQSFTKRPKVVQKHLNISCMFRNSLGMILHHQNTSLSLSSLQISHFDLHQDPHTFQH